MESIQQGSSESNTQNTVKTLKEQTRSIVDYMLSCWRNQKVTILLGVLGIGLGALLLTRAPKTIVVDGRQLPLPKGYFLSWGKWKIPLIGDQIDFLKSAFIFLEERAYHFGDAFYTNLFNSHTIVLSGAEGMKIFYNEKLITRNSAFPFHFIAGLLGPIENTMDGARFRERRHIVMRSIADPERVNLYLNTAQSIIDKYIMKWSLMREPFLFVDELHFLMAEVMSKVLLGVKDEESFAKFMKPYNDQVLYGLQALPIPIPYFFAYGNTLKASTILKLKYTSMLKKHMNGTWQTYNIPHAMEILAKGVKSQEDDDLNGMVTEIHHMMLAGEALLGNSLANLMMELWLHPSVYEKAKKMVHDNVSCSLISDHIPYLEMIANEIRRLFPYVPGMFGRAKKDFVFKGYGVPKGFTVIGAFYPTNLDAKEWTMPHSFDPDRFERGEPRSGMKYAWVPHGSVGARHMCAGTDFSTQFIKLFMKRLIYYDCKWELDSSQDFEQRMNLFNPEPKSKVRCLSFSIQNPSTA